MTEAEIRKALYPIVVAFGKVDMSQLKRMAIDYMDFNAEESEPSPTRPGEYKYNQKLRNVICHGIKSNCGYKIDNSMKPASIMLCKSFDDNDCISENEIFNRSIETGAGFDYPANRFIDKMQQDYIDFVIAYEKAKISILNPEATIRIIDMSKNYLKMLNKFSFNVLSLNEKLEPVEIFVVGTTSNDPTAIDTSKLNDFIKTRRNPGYSYIYKVYNFDKSANTGKIEIIKI